MTAGTASAGIGAARPEERGGRVLGLDVLRGVAIALVLARHTWPALFPGAGLVGVVVFFALSGHLITGLLVEELDRTGRLDLRGFYARRARRLLPALVLMLAVYALLTLTLDPVGERDRLLRSLIVGLTWTADLPFAHAGADVFHLWTLAVEEQFYLLWPVLLLALHRRGRLRLGVAVAGVMSLLACWAVVARLHHDPDLAYALPTTWACALVAGGWLRIAPPRRLPRPRVAGPLALVSLAALVGLGLLPLRGHLLTYLLGGPAIAGLTGVLLLAWGTWRTTRSDAVRLLAGLGRISYGVYLWNYPLALWLRPHDPTGLAALALSLIAALGSWQLWERRFAAPRRKGEPRAGR